MKVLPKKTVKFDFFENQIRRRYEDDDSQDESTDSNTDDDQEVQPIVKRLPTSTLSRRPVSCEHNL